MRIISGTKRGKQISVLKNFSDRPTTDIAKEGLFNVLKNMYYLEEFKVLDLFAGTGNISFEFVSNGVTDITCVDANPKYIDFINYQAKEIFPEVFFKCINSDVFNFAKKQPLDYDIIFADPPYNLEEVKNLPDLIFENKDLPDDALFILEHGKRVNFENHNFFFKEKKYGKVHFSFFKKK